MESKVYTLTLHRAAVSGLEYQTLRAGWRDSVSLPAVTPLHPGEWIMLCDRRNPREFIVKRILGAEPGLLRPDSLTVRFRRSPSAVIRCESGNMYAMEVAG